jgi:hypothetical protein
MDLGELPVREFGGRDAENAIRHEKGSGLRFLQDVGLVADDSVSYVRLVADCFPGAVELLPQGDGCAVMRMESANRWKCLDRTVGESFVLMPVTRVFRHGFREVRTQADETAF